MVNGQCFTANADQLNQLHKEVFHDILILRCLTFFLSFQARPAGEERGEHWTSRGKREWEKGGKWKQERGGEEDWQQQPHKCRTNQQQQQQQLDEREQQQQPDQKGRQQQQQQPDSKGWEQQ